jgi:hypothetical protein
MLEAHGGKGVEIIPLGTTSIRTNNHTIFHLQILPNPPQRTRLCIQIIHWHIEEPLNLTGMQVHRDDMITSSRLQHIRNKFRRDRSPRFVLFVLARIREVRDHSRDAARGSRFASIDHDEKLHEPVIDVARGGGLEDEHWRCLLARLC